VFSYYVRWQRGAARIHSCAPCSNQAISPASRGTTANFAAVGGDPATDRRTDIVSFHRLCSGNYATINQKVDSRSDNCESKAAVKLLLITFWCRVAGDQHPTFNAPSCTSVLFCSLAVLDPRVGHTMDVLSPFIPVLCHSDWLFYRESCPPPDVVHPGRAWPSSPACTWHCSLYYLFLQATPLFPHGVTIVC